MLRKKKQQLTLALICITLSHSIYADKFSESQQALVDIEPKSEISKFTQAAFATFGFDPADFPFQFDFSGFIKNESFLDSRQNFTFGDGQFLLVPLQYLPDVNGCDINSRGQYNMATIETRMRNNIIGPDVYGMKTRGYIECDFFGNVDQQVDSMQLRHAYMELHYKNFRFLAGQTYHPLDYPAEAPDTVSFNSGSPMTPFLFSPQFRFGHESTHFDAYLSFIGNIARLGDGPQGISTIYFRNGMMPEINLHLRVKYDQENYIAGDINVKRICPRLSTNKNFKSVELLTNIGASLYFRYQHRKLTIWAKTVYIENGNDFVMIGGYAASCVNPETDRRQYTNIRFMSVWGEFIYDLGKFEPALFIGFGKNMGSENPVLQTITTNGVTENTIYGFGNNIATVARIAPRLRVYYFAPFLIATEIEITRASYGTLDSFGHVQNGIPVTNYRWELACYYIF